MFINGYYHKVIFRSKTRIFIFSSQRHHCLSTSIDCIGIYLSIFIYCIYSISKIYLFCCRYYHCHPAERLSIIITIDFKHKTLNHLFKKTHNAWKITEIPNVILFLTKRNNFPDLHIFTWLPRALRFLIWFISWLKGPYGMDHIQQNT